MALTVVAAVICLIAAGAALGFPDSWMTAFQVSVSGVTLVVVFAIQHTQGREQVAIQRKLDELIRATGADESLMMLEEAPGEVMRDVEEEQRDVRSTSPDANPH